MTLWIKYYTALSHFHNIAHQALDTNQDRDLKYEEKSQPAVSVWDSKREDRIDEDPKPCRSEDTSHYESVSVRTEPANNKPPDVRLLSTSGTNSSKYQSILMVYTSAECCFTFAFWS